MGETDSLGDSIADSESTSGPNSHDLVRKFYSKILDRIENPDPNSRTSEKGLVAILSEELPKEQGELKQFIDAYVSHEPLTENIINRLLPEMLEQWQFDAFEYTKIFYYPFPSKEESDLLLSIGRIILGKDPVVSIPSEIKLPKSLEFMKDIGAAREKDIRSVHASDVRLPDVLKKLCEDEYLSFDEIVPALPQKIHPYENHIISNHYYRHTEMRKAFRLSPEIIARIDEKFAPKTDGESDNIFGLMKSRTVDELHGYSAKTLVQMVLEHSSNVFSSDMPLSGYSAVLKLSPKEFIDNHLTSLMLILDLRFKNCGTKELLDSKGEKFVHGEAMAERYGRGEFSREFSIDTEISLHEKYVLVSFNREMDMFSMDYGAGFKVYGIKLLLENYCRVKGISYYGEPEILDSDKVFYIEKYKSAKFAKNNMDRIKNMLDDTTLLKVVDYCNHQSGFQAEIAAIHECECKEYYSEGSFKYDRSGYVIRKEDPGISQLKVEFPLKNLHILTKHPERYNPKIYELEAIEQIINLSKDWVPVVPGPEIEDDYIKVLQVAEEAAIANYEVMEWCEIVHSTITATEEEMEKDPELRAHIEKEKAIFSAPDKIVNSVSDSINNVFSYFEKTYGNLAGNSIYYLEQAKSRPEKMFSELEVLEAKLTYIKSTFNALKSQYALNPQEHSYRMIAAVMAKQQLTAQQNFKKLQERNDIDSLENQCLDE